jgi:hypothetical protein
MLFLDMVCLFYSRFQLILAHRPSVDNELSSVSIETGTKAYGVRATPETAVRPFRGGLPAGCTKGMA